MTMTNEQIEMEINNLKSQLSQRLMLQPLIPLLVGLQMLKTLTLVKAPQFQVCQAA